MSHPDETLPRHTDPDTGPLATPLTADELQIEADQEARRVHDERGDANGVHVTSHPLPPEPVRPTDRTLPTGGTVPTPRTPPVARRAHDDAPPLATSHLERTTRPSAGDHTSPGSGGHGQPEVIEKLRQPDNRSRLLLVIALLAGLAMIFSLISMAAVLAQGGDQEEPVLVDGVPCLVQEGEDGQSILFCQR